MPPKPRRLTRETARAAKRRTRQLRAAHMLHDVDGLGQQFASTAPNLRRVALTHAATRAAAAIAHAHRTQQALQSVLARNAPRRVSAAVPPPSPSRPPTARCSAAMLHAASATEAGRGGRAPALGSSLRVAAPLLPSPTAEARAGAEVGSTESHAHASSPLPPPSPSSTCGRGAAAYRRRHSFSEARDDDAAASPLVVAGRGVGLRGSSDGDEQKRPAIGREAAVAAARFEAWPTSVTDDPHHTWHVAPFAEPTDGAHANAPDLSGANPAPSQGGLGLGSALGITVATSAKSHGHAPAGGQEEPHAGSNWCGSHLGSVAGGTPGKASSPNVSTTTPLGGRGKETPVGQGAAAASPTAYCIAQPGCVRHVKHNLLRSLRRELESRRAHHHRRRSSSASSASGPSASREASREASGASHQAPCEGTA